MFLLQGKIGMRNKNLTHIYMCVHFVPYILFYAILYNTMTLAVIQLKSCASSSEKLWYVNYSIIISTFPYFTYF